MSLKLTRDEKTPLAFGIARLLKPPGEILGGEVWMGGKDLAKVGPRELRGMRWRDFSVSFRLDERPQPGDAHPHADLRRDEGVHADGRGGA